MEFFIGLFAVFWILAVPVVAIIALILARSSKRRISDLELEVKSLRGRLDGASASASKPPPAPVAKREPEREAFDEPRVTTAPDPTSMEGSLLAEQPEETPAQRVVRTAHEDMVEPRPGLALERKPPAKPLGKLPVKAPAKPKVKVGAGIEWERLFGVRGAAILGGIALALAGLFLVQVAITEGWIGPTARVAIAGVFGVVCLIGKELLHKRGYGLLGNVIAGAGAVILYGAAWAGYQLYGLFPFWAAAVWMLLVTATCAVLALRHDSQLIAVFGLVGGFATPLLLSTGEDKPIQLFGYVLLLDIAMLGIARKRAWPAVAALGLLCTTGLQALWVANRMDPGEALIGLSILGVFSVVFAIAGSGVSQEKGRPLERLLWLLSQAGGVLFPFFFAVYFASRVQLDDSLVPLGGLLALLGAGAMFVASDARLRLLPVAAAAGSIGILLAAAMGDGVDALFVKRAAGVIAGVALVHAIGGEWTKRRWPVTEGPLRWVAGPGVSAALASVGGLVVLAVVLKAADHHQPFTPPMAGALGLTLIVLWCAVRFLPMTAALGGFATATVLAFYRDDHALAANAGFPGDLYMRGFVALCALAYVILAVAKRGTFAGRSSGVGAVACSLLFLIVDGPRVPEPAPFLAAVLVLATIATLGAAFARSGVVYAAVILLVPLSAMEAAKHPRQGVGLEHTPEVLGWFAATAALLTLLPFLFRSALKNAPGLGRMAAVAPLMWFLNPNYIELFESWKPEVPFVLPLALAALAGAGYFLTQTNEDSRRGPVAVWYAATCALLLAFTPAIQIDEKWLLIGFAVASFAWIAIARHFGHTWLRLFGTLVGSLIALFLVNYAADPWHFERSENLLWNWLSYVYLVPAACFFASLPLLPKKGWKRLKELPIERILLGTGGALLVFVWLNFEVLNYFGEGEKLAFRVERDPARNLTHSVVWGLYSFALLAIGTVRGVSGLRWMSLAFVLATIAKVFLYDLAELEGLYRAGSFFGLAVCLLFVSLFYQRFVFKQPEGDLGGDSATSS